MTFSQNCCLNSDVRLKFFSMRSKGGAVVRALASHQCGPGSNPGVDAICGLRLLLVLSLAPRGFTPGTPVFPSPQKPAFSNSNSTRNQTKNHYVDVLPANRYFIYFFIYLFIYVVSLHQVSRLLVFETISTTQSFQRNFVLTLARKVFSKHGFGQNL